MVGYRRENEERKTMEAVEIIFIHGTRYGPTVDVDVELDTGN